MAVYNASGESGPSPRTWGEPVNRPTRAMYKRTIPTHVGRTTPRPPGSVISTDHPHARGENGNNGTEEQGICGPSPRTWGELLRSYESSWAVRTIPTHVGRTRTGSTLTAWYTDHPHARGENSASSRRMAWTSGPSPRTWGERARATFGALRRRTIPTHVGRTYSLHSSSVMSPDHPHARGENFKQLVHATTKLGPSPRTWGERPGVIIALRAHRTIPTHVGRTCSPELETYHLSDHPHARGENTLPLPLAPNISGPSPRTWGELLCQQKP